MTAVAMASAGCGGAAAGMTADEKVALTQSARALAGAPPDQLPPLPGAEPVALSAISLDTDGTGPRVVIFTVSGGQVVVCQSRSAPIECLPDGIELLQRFEASGTTVTVYPVTRLDDQTASEWSRVQLAMGVPAWAADLAGGST